MKLFLQMLRMKGNSKRTREERAKIWEAANPEEQSMTRSLLETYTIELHAMSVRVHEHANHAQTVLTEANNGTYKTILEKIESSKVPELNEIRSFDFQELSAHLNTMEGVTGMSDYLDQLDQDLEQLLK